MVQINSRYETHQMASGSDALGGSRGDGQMPKIISSEYSYVAYLIKGNTHYNIMLAISLPLHTSPTPVVGSKGHFVFFFESGHVAYQFKGQEL